MKKVIKFVVWTVVLLVLLVIVLVATLPLWFGPVVKAVANSAVPQVTKTGFNLGHLSLNPYTARFELGDMQLKNPEGYPQEFAVTLGALNFDAVTDTLATDVIHIEEITIRDVFVSYVSGGENKVDNFTQIQYNVAGGKEQYEAKRERAQLEEVRAKEDAQAARRDEASAGEKPSTKFVIDRLEVSGIVVQYGLLPIRVPSLVLTDIGKESSGSTMGEVWNEIVEAVFKAVGVAGDQLKALGSFTTEAAGQVADKSVEAVGQVTDGAAKATGAAAKAVGDTAGKATEGAAKAAGAATKAVGDTAGKALDSLKKLW